MRGHNDSTIANRLAWRAKVHAGDDSQLIIDESDHSAVIKVVDPSLTIGVNQICQGALHVELDEIKSWTHNSESLRRNGKLMLDAIDLTMNDGTIVTIRTPPGKCCMAVMSLILMITRMQKPAYPETAPDASGAGGV